MDQHAAHERVLFEKMLSCLDQNAVPSQRLLLPETIELSPKDAFFLSEYLEVFNKLGIGISKFGDRTYIIDSVPFFFKKQSARSFLLDVIDTIKASGPQINKLRLGENEIAKAVCKNAVKAHDPLKKEEILVLLDELKKCKMPFTCPHGRPTLVEISFRELGRKFGRIV
jgi:DNA mismatch repair protein MutL